jgi:hypothetical protein
VKLPPMYQLTCQVRSSVGAVAAVWWQECDKERTDCVSVLLTCYVC